MGRGFFVIFFFSFSVMPSLGTKNMVSDLRGVGYVIKLAMNTYPLHSIGQSRNSHLPPGLSLYASIAK